MWSLFVAIGFLILGVLGVAVLTSRKAKRITQQAQSDFQNAMQGLNVQSVEIYKRPYAFGSLHGVAFSFMFHNHTQASLKNQFNAQKLLLRVKVPHSQNLQMHLSVLSKSNEILRKATGWQEVLPQFWLAARYQDQHAKNIAWIENLPQDLKQRITNLANEFGSVSLIHKHLINQIGKDNTLLLLKNHQDQLENLDLEIMLPLGLPKEKRDQILQDVIQLVKDLGESTQRV